MAMEPFATQFVAALARAGIAVPADRLAEVVETALELRIHVERINAACAPEAVPATVFVPPS